MGEKSWYVQLTNIGLRNIRDYIVENTPESRKKALDIIDKTLERKR